MGDVQYEYMHRRDGLSIKCIVSADASLVRAQDAPVSLPCTKGLTNNTFRDMYIKKWRATEHVITPQLVPNKLWSASSRKRHHVGEGGRKGGFVACAGGLSCLLLLSSLLSWWCVRGAERLTGFQGGAKWYSELLVPGVVAPPCAPLSEPGRIALDFAQPLGFGSDLNLGAQGQVTWCKGVLVLTLRCSLIIEKIEAVQIILSRNTGPVVGNSTQ